MAKFKNVITGNTVSTTNPAAIALMENSKNYVAVNGGKKDSKKSADGADDGKSE